MIDGRYFFDQLIKNDLKTFDNIRKIETGEGYNYKTGCLIDYPYFKIYYKLVAIDLRKQQKLNADPKSTQQIKFTGNLDRAEIATMFFIIKEATKKSLRFFKRNSYSIKILFSFNIKMTQYNTLNVKLSNSPLNNLRSAIKYGIEITLNFSSNFIGHSNVETNFPHKLLLTDTKVSEIRKDFGTGSSVYIKFPKTQLSKIVGEVLRDIPIFGNILSSVDKKETDIARNFEKSF